MNAEATILVVEDNDDDVYFMRRALKEAGVRVDCVQFAADGQVALDYLQGAGAYADRGMFPLPGVIFLDLKMPFVSGLEVLAAIRKDPKLSATPVYILTSSSEQRDRSQAAEIGVQGYLVKPPSCEMLEPILGRG